MSRIYSVITFICAVMLLFTGCDLESDVKYLSKANQKDVVSFLSAHKDSIRQNYHDWDGTVVDFDISIEMPMPINNELCADGKITLSGKFFIDSRTGNAYCVEGVVIYVGEYPLLSIDCSGYITSSNKIYYENYHIGGVLISQSEKYFVCSTNGLIDTGRWMKFFAPSEFLFSLYDYSFEELANMGEIFYFGNGKRAAYSCKVVHSSKYAFKEHLVDWKKAGEILSDSYLSKFGVSSADIEEYLSNEGQSLEEFKKHLKNMDYYTIYEFDSEVLNKATVYQKYSFDNDIAITSNYQLYSFDSEILFDESIYEERDVMFNVEDFFDGFNIDDYVEK